MPRLALVTFALGAQDSNGLISMLSGFIEGIQGPQLPIRQYLWAVARLHVDVGELGQEFVVVTRVEHADGEQIVRVETNVIAQQSPHYSPDLPIGVNLTLPLSLEFRREGMYRLSLTTAGELLGEAPLRVTAQFPAM